MRSTSRLHVSIVLTAGTLLLFGQTACSDKGGTTPPTPVPTTVTLSKTSVSLAAIGATEQLTASVKDQNGSPMTATVTWASNNEAVATVSGTGLVTGYAAALLAFRADNNPK